MTRFVFLLAAGMLASALWACSSQTSNPGDADLNGVEDGFPMFPPEVEILSPMEGQCVERGAVLTLQASAFDPNLPADRLQVAWRSERSGALGTSSVGSDGLSEHTTVLSLAGTHVLTATAINPQGLTGEDSVTIRCSVAPWAPTVEILPRNPTAGDPMRAVVSEPFDPDGDDVSLAVKWTHRLPGEPEKSGPSGTGVLEVEGATTKTGETWTVMVTPVDACNIEGPSVTASVIIGNAPPGWASPDDPTSPGSNGVQVKMQDLCSADGSLLCAHEEAIDPEGEEISYEVDWVVDGVPVTDQHSNFLERWDFSSTPATAHFSRGSGVRCAVTPIAGGSAGERRVSWPLVVDNCPPAFQGVASLDHDPIAHPGRWTCSGSVLSSYDADSDPWTLFFYWYVDGVLVSSTTDMETPWPHLEATLEANHNVEGTSLTADAAVSCGIRMFDGQDVSLQEVQSSAKLEGNHAPDAGGAVLIACVDQEIPESIWAPAIARPASCETPETCFSNLIADAYACREGQRIQCFPPVQVDPLDPLFPSPLLDKDGDEVYWVMSWFVNGVVVQGQTAHSLSSEFFNKGDDVSCTATPVDEWGLAGPSSPSKWTVTVLNTLPQATCAKVTPTTGNHETEFACAPCSPESWNDPDPEDLPIYSWRWYELQEDGTWKHLVPLVGQESVQFLWYEGADETYLESGRQVRCELIPWNSPAIEGIRATSPPALISPCLVPDTQNLCSDGDPCTVGDTCSGTTCLPGTGLLHCDDGNLCTADACEPGLGCLHEPLTQTACDDGFLCTDPDRCVEGVCVGTPVNCDDNDVCTTDFCHPSQGCSHLFNQAFCQDGNPCTVGDRCLDGLCRGVELLCDDQNPCTQDACYPAVGCRFDPVEGLPCEDGNPCTTGDTCSLSQCLPGTNICLCTNDDDCQPNEDGDLCNGSLFCAEDGSCQTDPETVIHCPELDDCHVNVCQPTTGQCAAIQRPDGFPCNDDNECTTADFCDSGVCAGEPESIDDDNVCTLDSCNPTTGVVSHQPQPGAACDDENPCTLEDTCSASGTCLPGDPWTAPPVEDCMDRWCHPILGIILVPLTGASCDDGDACTMGDHCQSGHCVGENLCQCQNDQDCAPFEDGDLCNGTLSCDENLCVVDPATLPTCPQSTHPCSHIQCDPSTGDCLESQLPDGSPCDDQDPCTGPDHCSNGSCSPGEFLCTCRPAMELACGSVDRWNTGGDFTTQELSDYPCLEFGQPGPEYSYLLNAQTSTRFTASLISDVPASLAVLQGNSPCDAQSCLHGAEGNNISVTWDALAGDQFYLVVDSGATTGAYQIEIQCDSEQACANGIDENLDGLRDCRDPDCTGDPACALPPVRSPLPCNSRWSGTTQGDSILPTCQNLGFALPGPEVFFSWTAPKAGTFHAELLEGSDTTARLVLLDGAETPTQGSPCLVVGTSVSLAVQPGDSLLLAVDSTSAEATAYVVQTDCLGEVCNDGIDNDGDGRIDCLDDWCQGASPCNQNTRSHESPLFCGQRRTAPLPLPDDTAQWSSYSCTHNEFPGPEQVLILDSEFQGTLLFTLSQATPGTTLLALPRIEGMCRPDLCSNTATTALALEKTADQDWCLVLEGPPGTSGSTTLDVRCLPAQQISPRTTLSCGETFLWNTALEPGTGHVSDYACAHTDMGGPETAILLQIDPGTSFQVDLLSESDQTAFLVETQQPTCPPEDCVASGTNLSHSVQPDTRYCVVVDGPGSGGFALTVRCPELCDNGLDDDQDGVADCLDTDCAAAESCTPSCQPIQSLACGETVHWDASWMGTTHALQETDCAPGVGTGPEVTFRFDPQEEGQAALELTNAPETAMLLWLEGEPPCNPQQCLAADSFRIETPFEAGGSYLAVVELPNPPGAFDLTLLCNESDCFDLRDNDRDGTVDCDDSDCNENPACAPDRCRVQGTLSCGETFSGNTAMFESTSHVDQWPLVVTPTPGPELALRFQHPTGGAAQFHLDNPQGDLRLLALAGWAQPCNPAYALQTGLVDVNINALADKDYTLVVDGSSTSGSDFSLTAHCPGVELCQGSLDEDADGLVDCDDPDCWGSNLCQTGTCSPKGLLVCGDRKTGASNAWGSTSNLDLYPCIDWLESGPEWTWEFRASHTGWLALQLDSQAPLDLLVLDGALGCTSEACIAAGDNLEFVWVTPGTLLYVVVDGPDNSGGSYELLVDCFDEEVGP